MAAYGEADEGTKPEEGDEDQALRDAKDIFKLCQDNESDNRRDYLDDLRFARLGEQWPADILAKRKTEGRPALTINRLPSFSRQVCNDARQNKPGLKVKPVDSRADPETAKVMSDLIRQIEVSGGADIARDTAAACAVDGGFGYYALEIAYTHDESFDKELKYRRFPDPLNVWGDPFSKGADSADWNHAFITELMRLKDFEAKWKDAEPVDWDGSYKLESPWKEGEEVLLAEYWCRKEVQREIVLLSDGRVVDADWYAENKEFLEAQLQPILFKASRDVLGHQVVQYIMTGAEILETNDWPGRFIPIIPVYGDDLVVEGTRYLKSLIRDAKGAQQNYNFWRSAATELVALAPKVPFLMHEQGLPSDDDEAQKWETANRESHPYLLYKGAQAPQRQPLDVGPAAGALQEAANANDDMKGIIGMYDASLGARSNETSGRAIMVRQREGDVSTFHFQDNLNRAIRHEGRILVDLIPHVYDGPRIARVLGPDGETREVPLNQAFATGPEKKLIPAPGLEAGKPYVLQGGAPMAMPQPMAGQAMPQPAGVAGIYDLGAGKYDLVVDTGPSFTTRREEAATQMMEMLRAFPQAAPFIGDILAKNLNWPGADEIAERLKALIPKPGQGGDDGAGAKIAEQIETLRQALAKAEMEAAAAKGNTMLKTEELRLKGVETEIKRFEAETERMKVTGEIAAKMHAARNPPAPPDSGAPPIN